MLSSVDRKRYARHLLLPEIGLAGQAQLLASARALPAGADARVAEVAGDYLQRAGVALRASGAEVALAPLAAAEVVDALAGRAELREAAAALAGAFGAVEAIKGVLGVGTPGALPASLTLARAEELAP